MPRPSPAMAAAPVVRIYLLGSFRTERDAQTIRLPTRKVESLLAYLVLHPEPHAREKLAALLWGDSTDELARRSLRTALSALRKALGDELLLADRETIQISPDFPLWVDAREIADSEIENPYGTLGSLQSKIENYRGDLLPDFYDDWILPERQRLRTLFLNTLLQLAQHARAESKYPQAIEFAQKMLASDPANEKAYQHLIFCSAALGDRIGALKQYDECERKLRDELGVAPSQETIALRDRIEQAVTGGKSREALLTNLPHPLTSFIGREKEIAEVKPLLAQYRLVTLTGSGGCGKTRLAIEVATELVESFPHGVWWVDLAPLSDASLVPQAVAQALGVQESPNQSLEETLIYFMHSNRLLLVVDNCEHLIDACARLADKLLSACAELKMLATSREALGITGEAAWRVPSFALPDVENLPPLAELVRYDAIQLFVQRATAVVPQWRMNGDAPAVARVCARLDGMPLAIELAVARLKVLSVEQIAARLDDRFRLLTLGSRTAPTRQQTLRETINWSYYLLTEQEQAFLRRLSVFAGGWTLEAAEQICSGDGLASSEIMDLLARLVDKSLVIAQTGEARYHMLETIRQYTQEKLTEPTELQSLQKRQCDFFVQLAETAEPQLKGPNTKVWMDRLEMDYDNIRAVLEYAMTNDVAAAVRLASALVMFWVRRTYLIEGRRLLAQLLERTEIASVPSLRLHVLNVAGYVEIYTNDSAVIHSYFKESLAIANRLGDKGNIAHALHGMGRVFILRGDYTSAKSYLETSLTFYRETDDRWGTAQTLYSLGSVVSEQGDRERGQALLEESLQVFDAIGDIWGVVWPLTGLGDLARRQGNYDRAAEFYTKCIEIDRGLGEQIHIGYVMRNLGLAVLKQGNYRRAAEIFAESVEYLQRRGRPILLVQCLCAMASIIRWIGKPASAARLLGAVNAELESFGAKGIVRAPDHELYQDILDGVRAELDADTFVKFWREGHAMNFDRAVEFALSEMKILDVPDTRGAAASPRQIAKEKFNGLTAREREVAVLIAQGKSNRAIAERLVLGERTVESYVSNILNKLGFTARTQIAAWAVQKGMLEKTPAPVEGKKS